MHEHIARILYHLQIHLLFASIVWFAAWILTSAVKGSATAKYWIWIATVLNFILPVGAVLDKVWTSHLLWATPLLGVGGIGASIASSWSAVATLSSIWFIGASVMFARLCLRIWSDRSAAHGVATEEAAEINQFFLAGGVPVKRVGLQRVPAVNGILHPYISLPFGIEELLSKSELDAVLIHERTHAVRRDNLIRFIYELGLCLLWFHPLLWLTGSRIALYRELSCDESVIQRFHGRDLISALAKLANPEEPYLLQASATSFISVRLAQLSVPRPQRSSSIANTLLFALFAASLFAGVFETVAHTACCFVVRK